MSTIYWYPRWYYIKYHKETNTYYLGQHKYEDIMSYSGSGTIWKEIIKNTKPETIWAHWFEHKSEAEGFLKEFEECHPGYYHRDNHLWANMIPENTMDSGFIPTEETKSSISNSLKSYFAGNDWDNKKEQINSKISKSMVLARKNKYPEDANTIISDKAKLRQNDPEWIKTSGAKKSKNQKETINNEQWRKQNWFVCEYCNKGPMPKTPYKRFHGNNCKEK